MKIIQFLGNSQLQIDETPKPTGDASSVILKVKASGLCGSELSRYRGEPYPSEGFFNTGHEVVGIIEDCPSDSGYKPGMRVGARVVQGCGNCETCNKGQEVACLNITSFSSNGHGEYFRLGLNGIQEIPDDVDWPQSVILTGDGLGVPVRCSGRLGDTRGKQILVLGLGPVGLSCLLVQVFKGAEVMGADLSTFRLSLASQLGATKVVNVNTKDLKKEVLNWTEGNGVDIVILAVGKNETLLQAIDLVRHQGILFQVGELNEATFNPSAAFIRKEITMTGSWYYTSADWKDMLAFHKAGLCYKKLISHTFPFEKAQDAFNTFASGDSGKVILTYE